jgi:HSP20 family protein
MMRLVAQFPFVPAGDLRELGDDIRELFADLEERLPADQRVYSGECHPVLDVLETATGIEIILDVTGVPAEAMRVLLRNNVVLVAGEKAPQRMTADATYHLVEREFGRFARAVRLTGAFEGAAARAWLDAGELTIIVPRRAERRGQAQTIPISGSRVTPA